MKPKKITKKIDKLLNKYPIRNGTMFYYLSIMEYLRLIEGYEEKIKKGE